MLRRLKPKSEFIPIVNHSLKYNPAIDGLRGVAITLVLLFHIWPEYFSFGYVGVDIFFVLSGYLITQIIYTKLETNTFSFKEFYRNRIRRIFPAMLIVVFTASIIGYLFMFPSELEQLGRHIKSSALFYQNFRLSGEVGYWDEASQLKPLLHFWSLSIEEQFYLLWPLIILAIYKLRWNLFLSLGVLFVLLLIVPQFFKIDLFYHSFARFWELCFGGLVFAFSTRFDTLKFTDKFKLIIYLVFVVAIAMTYKNTQFDLYKTLFVVISTGLLILVLVNNTNQKIFSSTSLVFLGLISFPLYLWHYVFISYMHIFGLDVQAYGFVVIFILVFISYLTYRYVELYARKQTSYKLALTLFSIAIVLGLFGQYINKQKGLPQRSHLGSNERYQAQFVKPAGKDNNGQELAKKILGYTAEQSFLRATNSSNVNILIAGDSHAYSSYIGFSEEFEKHGLDSLLFATNSCPPYIGLSIGRTEVESKQCFDRTQELIEVLEKSKFNKIFFITRGPKYIYKKGYGSIDNEDTIKDFKYYDCREMGMVGNIMSKKHEEIFYQNVDLTLKYLNTLSTPIYYVLENPELGFSPKNCMIRPFDVFPSKCRVLYDEYQNRMREYKNNIIVLASKYQNINILDPEDLFCDANYCYAIKDGKMLYADDDHLSVDGSMAQAKYFIDEIFSDKATNAN